MRLSRPSANGAHGWQTALRRQYPRSSTGSDAASS
jgi:hypothetical protein